MSLFWWVFFWVAVFWLLGVAMLVAATLFMLRQGTDDHVFDAFDPSDPPAASQTAACSEYPNAEP